MVPSARVTESEKNAAAVSALWSCPALISALWAIVTRDILRHFHAFLPSSALPNTTVTATARFSGAACGGRRRARVLSPPRGLMCACFVRRHNDPWRLLPVRPSCPRVYPVTMTTGTLRHRRQARHSRAPRRHHAGCSAAANVLRLARLRRATADGATGAHAGSREARRDLAPHAAAVALHALQ